ncbi:DUF177 domain-containing protein [Falsihalocynthiibacter sp. SS001]|uniref:YceD family protein n=1 Tax=Falsihalocynthiibacter sp. SS001 TaxID=3349698 RepID=UPI0036D3D78A
MTRAPKPTAPRKASAPQPANSTPWSHPLRVADLAQRKDTRFSLIPDDATLKAIAKDLQLDGLKKMRFEGTLSPQGKSDWQLSAKLGATVTQPCVITLAPVNTRIDGPVTRVFVKDTSVFDIEDEEEIEVESQVDESLEPLGATIDLGEVMVEALALALPLYPRAEGAELGEAQFAAPGVAPLQDEDARPFAGLANLLKTGEKPEKE